jgi:hypothetical protein
MHVYAQEHMEYMDTMDNPHYVKMAKTNNQRQ